MRLIIHVDGGSRGNPGPAAAGVVINSLDPSDSVHEAGYFLGMTTNNVAEYQGLIRALQIARQLRASDILIHSDSELLVRQVHGTYKVKSPLLRPLKEEVVRNLENFGHWALEYVRREQNQRADELVNLALDEGRDVIEIDVNELIKKEQRAAKNKRSAESDPRITPNAPQFKVHIENEAGDRCPVPFGVDQVFEVGPRTPAEMCIYAAKAVFMAIDLDDPTITRCATCALCGMKIRIEPKHQ